MRRKSCLMVIWVLLMAFSMPLFSQHEITLPVSLYGKQSYSWGGAATGQMIMNGYPANPLFYTQQVVWNTIQLYNSDNEPVLWATDPSGLSQTMMQLNQPIGSWGIISNDVRYDTLFQVLFWMNNNSYPAAILIDAGEKWVVVTGYVTDVEPLQGTTPTLWEITINDPDPANQGSTYTLPGNVWLDTYWNYPVEAEGTWYNKYVAVVEPPIVQGTISVPAIDRAGGVSKKMITPGSAIEHAQKAIDANGFRYRKPYEILDNPSMINYEPILVCEMIDPIRVEKKITPYYYIIPYGYSYEKKGDKEAVRIAILVNAFTGNFEEIIAFETPQTYITREEAIATADDYLKKNLIQRDFSATLRVEEAVVEYQPSDLTHLRACPFWRITYSDSTSLYVQQSGAIHIQIPVSPTIYGK